MMRRQIGALYVELERCFWGVCLETIGTKDELIAAGVASEYMFEGMRKHGRVACDEHGDKFHLEKRAGGRFKLTRYFGDKPRRPHGWGKKERLDLMPRVLEIRDSGLSA